jgi:hypothetical protein
MEKDYSPFNTHRLYNEKDIIDFIKSIPSDDWKYDYLDKHNLQNLSFWGYGEKESDAPSSQGILIPHGRVNPSGIIYLYTARDPATAISEVQPTIGQLISIAKITTLKRLNIFNFNFPHTYKDSGLMKKPIYKVEEELGLLWGSQTSNHFNSSSHILLDMQILNPVLYRYYVILP